MFVTNPKLIYVSNFTRKYSSFNFVATEITLWLLNSLGKDPAKNNQITRLLNNPLSGITLKLDESKIVMARQVQGWPFTITITVNDNAQESFDVFLPQAALDDLAQTLPPALAEKLMTIGGRRQLRNPEPPARQLLIIDNNIGLYRLQHDQNHVAQLQQNDISTPLDQVMSNIPNSILHALSRNACADVIFNTTRQLTVFGKFMCLVAKNHALQHPTFGSPVPWLTTLATIIARIKATARDADIYDAYEKLYQLRQQYYSGIVLRFGVQSERDALARVEHKIIEVAENQQHRVALMILLSDELAKLTPTSYAAQFCSELLDALQTRYRQCLRDAFNVSAAQVPYFLNPFSQLQPKKWSHLVLYFGDNLQQPLLDFVREISETVRGISITDARHDLFESMLSTLFPVTLQKTNAKSTMALNELSRELQYLADDRVLLVGLRSGLLQGNQDTTCNFTITARTILLKSAEAAAESDYTPCLRISNWLADLAIRYSERSNTQLLADNPKSVKAAGVVSEPALTLATTTNLLASGLLQTLLSKIVDSIARERLLVTIAKIISTWVCDNDNTSTEIHSPLQRLVKLESLIPEIRNDYPTVHKAVREAVLTEIARKGLLEEARTFKDRHPSTWSSHSRLQRELICNAYTDLDNPTKQVTDSSRATRIGRLVDLAMKGDEAEYVDPIFPVICFGDVNTELQLEVGYWLLHNVIKDLPNNFRNKTSLESFKQKYLTPPHVYNRISDPDLLALLRAHKRNFLTQLIESVRLIIRDHFKNELMRDSTYSPVDSLASSDNPLLKLTKLWLDEFNATGDCNIACIQVAATMDAEKYVALFYRPWRLAVCDHTNTSMYHRVNAQMQTAFYNAHEKSCAAMIAPFLNVSPENTAFICELLTAELVFQLYAYLPYEVMQTVNAGIENWLRVPPGNLDEVSKAGLQALLDSLQDVQQQLGQSHSPDYAVNIYNDALNKRRLPTIAAISKLRLFSNVHNSRTLVSDAIAEVTLACKSAYPTLPQVTQTSLDANATLISENLRILQTLVSDTLPGVSSVIGVLWTKIIRLFDDIVSDTHINEQTKIMLFPILLKIANAFPTTMPGYTRTLKRLADPKSTLDAMQFRECLTTVAAQCRSGSIDITPEVASLFTRENLSELSTNLSNIDEVIRALTGRGTNTLLSNLLTALRTAIATNEEFNPQTKVAAFYVQNRELTLHDRRLAFMLGDTQLRNDILNKCIQNPATVMTELADLLEQIDEEWLQNNIPKMPIANTNPISTQIENFMVVPYDNELTAKCIYLLCNDTDCERYRRRMQDDKSVQDAYRKIERASTRLLPLSSKHAEVLANVELSKGTHQRLVALTITEIKRLLDVAKVADRYHSRYTADHVYALSVLERRYLRALEHAELQCELEERVNCVAQLTYLGNQEAPVALSYHLLRYFSKSSVLRRAIAVLAPAEVPLLPTQSGCAHRLALFLQAIFANIAKQHSSLAELHKLFRFGVHIESTVTVSTRLRQINGKLAVATIIDECMTIFAAYCADQLTLTDTLQKIYLEVERSPLVSNEHRRELYWLKSLSAWLNTHASDAEKDLQKSKKENDRAKLVQSIWQNYKAFVIAFTNNIENYQHGTSEYARLQTAAIILVYKNLSTEAREEFVSDILKLIRNFIDAYLTDQFDNVAWVMQLYSEKNLPAAFCPEDNADFTKIKIFIQSDYLREWLTTAKKAVTRQRIIPVMREEQWRDLTELCCNTKARIQLSELCKSFQIDGNNSKTSEFASLVNKPWIALLCENIAKLLQVVQGSPDAPPLQSILTDIHMAVDNYNQMLRFLQACRGDNTITVLPFPVACLASPSVTVLYATFIRDEIMKFCLSQAQNASPNLPRLISLLHPFAKITGDSDCKKRLETLQVNLRLLSALHHIFDVCTATNDDSIELGYIQYDAWVLRRPETTLDEQQRTDLLAHLRYRLNQHFVRYASAITATTDLHLTPAVMQRDRAEITALSDLLQHFRDPEENDVPLMTQIIQTAKRHVRDTLKDLRSKSHPDPYMIVTNAIKLILALSSTSDQAWLYAQLLKHFGIQSSISLNGDTFRSNSRNSYAYWIIKLTELWTNQHQPTQQRRVNMQPLISYCAHAYLASLSRIAIPECDENLFDALALAIPHLSKDERRKYAQTLRKEKTAGTFAMELHVAFNATTNLTTECVAAM